MPLITVLDYDPAWPDLFDALRGPIADALGGIALAIEHVGSTAVPGLSAKPIVDIAVVVRPGDVSAAIARLAPLGYVHKGDLGVPGREAMAHPPATPRHHLYVCPEGNLALANQLAVRDHLRANPAAARAYAALKKRLAIEFADDVEGYVEGKTGFILDILHASGFAEGDLAAIAAINRRPGRE
jgi:GrpB-like predicted nucleotidyltransferase (UPF0157 family)